MPEKETIDPDFSESDENPTPKEQELYELHPQAWNLLNGPCSKQIKKHFPSFASIG